MTRHNRTDAPKTKQIYEIPNDDSKGEVLPITAAEVKSLKKDKLDLHQSIQATLTLLKTSKLPSEVISDIFSQIVKLNQNNLNTKYRNSLKNNNSNNKYFVKLPEEVGKV